MEVLAGPARLIENLRTQLPSEGAQVSRSLLERSFDMEAPLSESLMSNAPHRSRRWLLPGAILCLIAGSRAVKYHGDRVEEIEGTFCLDSSDRLFPCESVSLSTSDNAWLLGVRPCWGSLSEESAQRLDGVGPALARHLLDAQPSTPSQPPEVEELLEIPGVGPAKASVILDGLRPEGCAPVSGE